MKPKYQWLYFDLDNTLLDFDASSKAAFFKIFSNEGLRLSEDDYADYLKINKKIWKAFEEGKISAKRLKVKRWELFFENKDIDLDPNRINEAYFEELKVNPIFMPHCQELLTALAPHYPRLAIITNGLSEVQRSRLQLSGLNHQFDPIVISDEIGHAKPSKQFFDFVQEKTGQPSVSDVLVIGDTLGSDIRGGLDYGFDTCWMDIHKIGGSSVYPSTYTVSNLKELGLLLAL